MNIFDFRNHLIDDYAAYIKSFININDERIRTEVDEKLKVGQLYPDPLIQLNPSFASGGFVDDLVKEGSLHPECSRIFRRNKSSTDMGKPLRLHKHQKEAIHTARAGDNYVITTGTGSGKSLTYIIPIVDYVLRQGSSRGIKAIVVYPMNALANSQAGELEKFLIHGYPEGRQPVTFKRYTGQETDQEKNAIIANPPDILLTNYVMLELILTRPTEQDLIGAAKGLKFLVLDELHTYRGRQGADVAMLVRRVRDRVGVDNLQCVGTSATMSSQGSYSERQAVVAEVASSLFGSPVRVENVIGETLERATADIDFSKLDNIEALKASLLNIDELVRSSHATFVQDTFASWIESTFGVKKEESSGRLVRSSPKRIRGQEGVAEALSKLTGVGEETCIQSLEKALLAGYNIRHPDTNQSVFAFRLHQFISRGDTVYASLEPEDTRYITMQAQQYVPGERSKLLLPLAFCRECGQEYYTVWRDRDVGTGRTHFKSRRFSERLSETGGEPGFLYYSQSKPWENDTDGMYERIPDDWLEDEGVSKRGVRSNYRKYLPEDINIAPDGTHEQGASRYQFVAAPFRFCLCCGVSYSGRQSDFAKLALLSSEGRATATTVLSLSAVQRLKSSALPKEARKLLSFTDNRQDASLQAGHFNDFVEVALLRSALYRAVRDAGSDGLGYGEITQKVFQALGLNFADYAADPGVQFRAKLETEQVLREVLGYRIYRDLKRGWRITAPNLEQTGLLEIRYESLEDICQAEEYWQNRHPALARATPEKRAEVAKILLDVMRRQLAIKVDYLDPDFHERLKQRSGQRLRGNWALDEREQLERSFTLFPRPRQGNDSRENVYLSARGSFGQYLRRSQVFPHVSRPNLEETNQIIKQLLDNLCVAGIVMVVSEPRNATQVPGYQLVAAAIRWHALDGSRTFYDPLKVSGSVKNKSSNEFFRAFYQETALQLHNIEAKEHTAQVMAEEREKREESFRNGELSVLYCSPTMELGVDISDLNVVNMRNVPPTPANYAQRSGRAGRSGQPALVFTYSSTGNSHDQYFFKRPERMVAGVVSPPRLDLTNEELLRAHVHAIWLSETGQNLQKTLKDILDLSQPELPVYPNVLANLRSPTAAQRAYTRCKAILDNQVAELEETNWYYRDWLEDVFSQVEQRFDATCERWRNLYKAALTQAETQAAIAVDPSRSPTDKSQAERLRRDALAQLRLLTDAENVVQSDFYSYRYFASEGFLPGYSFPRLPLSAYIPGTVGKKNKEEYVSRPRFLAISEFGPNSILYHEGAKYRVNRVILPPAEPDEEIASGVAKLCNNCGYVHPVRQGEGPDLCERCSARLPVPMRNLLRLQNVSTRRTERINSDEEERQRQGYEIVSGVRFEGNRQQASFRRADVMLDGQLLAELTYAQAATIWRMNLGWLRRENKQQQGFVLDVERGYWANDKALAEQDAETEVNDDPISGRLQRVVPYVEDHRNCLMWQPKINLEPEQMASLQAALKNAIQVQYQLEDDELATEPLPSSDDRRLILFYEASEGGAGVLRHLIDDAKAVHEVAKRALELCHFDPETGVDKRRAPHSDEDCEAACYDCLMSYRNQGDHLLLDRKVIHHLLLDLTRVNTQTSPTERSRQEQITYLMSLCNSDLERSFLRLLEQGEHRLPSDAQKLFAACSTRPDFMYEQQRVAVYIDGPHHDYPERQARDAQQTEAMEDAGYIVIRFSHQDDWVKLIEKYTYVFGSKA